MGEVSLPDFSRTARTSDLPSGLTLAAAMD